MATSQALRLVLVTPEKTLLDQPISAARFPMYDGLLGVLPGRAPLVGRLGSGELRFDADAGSSSYYVDGGFVQIKGSVVTLLTSRAMPVSEIRRDAAEAQLSQARSRVAHSDQEIAAKYREIERARNLLALAK